MADIKVMQSKLSMIYVKSFEDEFTPICYPVWPFRFDNNRPLFQGLFTDNLSH